MSKREEVAANAKPIKKYHVPALEKGLRILECLCLSPGGKTFSELSSELEISRTTVFSILHHLQDSGYVKKDAGGVFQPSLKMYSLGMETVRNLNRAEIFLPDATAIQRDLGHTVHVCGYATGETIVLEKLDGTGSISFKSYIGERKPLHLSAGGKAILAYLPEDEFAFYSGGELRKITENTLSTKEQLIRCRRRVRSDGYSLDDEEGEPGVFCFGAPLFIEGGGLFGSISISTLKISIDRAEFEQCVRRIQEAGRNISRRLGYSGDYPLHL